MAGFIILYYLSAIEGNPVVIHRGHRHAPQRKLLPLLARQRFSHALGQLFDRRGLLHDRARRVLSAPGASVALRLRMEAGPHAAGISDSPDHRGTGHRSNRTKPAQVPIECGSIMVLFPGVWHRYRPDANTGWTERWISFNGEIIQRLRRLNLLRPERAVQKIADRRAGERKLRPAIGYHPHPCDSEFDRALDALHRGSGRRARTARRQAVALGRTCQVGARGHRRSRSSPRR